MERPRFRSTLTFWLLAFVVLAVVCAVASPRVRDYIDKERVRQSRARWYREFESLGGKIYTQVGRYKHGIDVFEFRDCTRFSKRAPELLAELPDAVPAFMVENCSRVDDASLAPLSSVSSLRWLALSGTRVGTDGLPFCAGLTNLDRVELSRTLVDRRAIAVLAQLPKLEWLSLSGNQITNDDLLPLKGHPSLVYIDLENTAVTAGVADILKTIPKLASVDLNGTTVPIEEKVELLHLFEDRYPSRESKWEPYPLGY